MVFFLPARPTDSGLIQVPRVKQRNRGILRFFRRASVYFSQRMFSRLSLSSAFPVAA